MTDPNPHQRKRLFVIDDDQTVIDLLTMRLESHYDVAGTSKPAQGVDQVSLFGADLVLCDIDMPGMTGDRMARALRSDPRTASVPLVYLTGMLPAGETSTALGGGFGNHLAISKTASMDALLKLVEQALAKPSV